MDIVFRRFMQNSPREAPPGEWHLRAIDPACDSGLAKLALSGPAGFVGGLAPHPSAIVVNDDPTLDDMLALLFLQKQIIDTPSARNFAEFAKRARTGLYPSRQGGRVNIPIERSLEAVFETLRHNAADCATKSDSSSGTLHDPGCRQRFLADWEKLGALILRKIADGVDPHQQPLFDDTSEFDEELAFLEKDHDTYRRERDAGEKFLVEMTQRGVATPCAGLPALVVRGRSSYLLVPFSRSDPEAPDGKKFHLLCVKDPDQGWIVSTEPTDKYYLKPLAERLQSLENAATPPGQSPHIWRDGKPHKHTIVLAPESGSRLSDDAVIAAIKAWGRARPIPTSAARPATTAISAASPKAIRTLITVSIVGLCAALYSAWHFWPRPSPVTTPPAPPELVTSRIAPEAKYALSRAQETKLQTLPFSKGAGPRGGSAILPVPEDDVRRFAARLAWFGPERPVDPIQVTLPDRSIHIIRPDQWRKRPDHVWNPQDGAWVVAIESNNRTVQIDAPADDLGSYELEHTPIQEIHLHIMAVGVSDYASHTGQPPLKYPAADAEALLDAFCRTGRTLFTEIHTYGPPDAAKNRSRALQNGEATSSSIKKLLNEFHNGVAADRTKLKLAVVIFCGHGTAHTQQEFKYLPADYNPEDQNTRVLGGDIDGELNDLECPKLLIFDCCQSGLLSTRARGMSAEVNKSLAEATAQFAATKPARFLLSACQANKLAFESDAWGHGALTAAILQVLDNPKQHGDLGVLTLDHLRTKVADLVERMTRAAGLEQTIVPDFPAEANPRNISLAYFGDKSVGSTAP